MNENLIPIGGKTKQVRMLDGVEELVFNGERFYRIDTHPDQDKIFLESLFCNVQPGHDSGVSRLKAFRIKEPYYDVCEAKEEQLKPHCCFMGCNKDAEYNITSGPFDTDTTQSCEEHIGALLDTSLHFNIDVIH